MVNYKTINSEDGEIRKFPTLYSKSKSGKIKEWSIRVIYHHFDGFFDAFAEIITEHGYCKGNLKVAVKTVTCGKNIGKANQTTPLTQAISEAQSKYNKKLDQGYVTEPHGESKRLLPMLAQDYFKYSHKLDTTNFYVQPKLNGVRCLAKRDGDRILYFSRQGNLFDTLDHLTSDLLLLLEDQEIFDGEIYNHSMSLQEIVSVIKSGKDDKGRDKLQYWVYDMVEPSMTFNDRLIKLKRRFKDYLVTHTTLVQTLNQQEITSLDLAHTTFTTKGYEGIMIRNGSGRYEVSSRSSNLLKFKKFQSEEFEIVSGKGGTGKEKNCVIFTCATKEGKTFDVRPKGSLSERKQMYQSLDNYIGKKLTVIFFEYTPDGIPFHPVGEVVRDYE